MSNNKKIAHIEERSEVINNTPIALSKKKEDLDSLVRTIEKVMSKNNTTRYISDIISSQPIEYIALRPEKIVHYTDGTSEATQTHGLNLLYGLDRDIKIMHTQNILIYDFKWSRQSAVLDVNSLISTVLHEIQHSHYMTSEKFDANTDKLSNHDTNEFKKALHLLILIFKESKEGKAWISTHKDKHVFNQKEESIERFAMLKIDDAQCVIDKSEQYISNEDSIEQSLS